MKKKKKKKKENNFKLFLASQDALIPWNSKTFYIKLYLFLFLMLNLEFIHAVEFPILRLAKVKNYYNIWILFRMARDAFNIRNKAFVYYFKRNCFSKWWLLDTLMVKVEEINAWIGCFVSLG